MAEKTKVQNEEVIEQNWREHQKNAHPEDRMSYIDFYEEFTGLTYHYRGQ